MSRVVIFPSAYLPSLGGVEELTRHLALALVRAGDEVEIWTQQDEERKHPAVETMDGLKVRRFSWPMPRAHPVAVAKFALGAVSATLAMRSAAKEFRPEVLHVQCFGPNGFYATLLSQITGVPLVISLQGETLMDDHDAYEVSASLRTALRLGFRRAAAVTACSQFTLDDSRSRFGLAGRRGQVIFNGVDLGDTPAPGGETPTCRYVLALGRIEDKKGFDLLIDSFSRVAPGHPDVDLVIGGIGSAQARLQDLATGLDLGDRVRFVGRLSRQEVANAMANADVFVIPSRVEPFGIVILEAWRAGRAAIVTSHGGPPEFVTDGVDAVVVDPFDTAALASAIDVLLSDADQRRRLGAAAQRRVLDFDWSTISEQYRACYRTVAGRGPGG